MLEISARGDEFEHGSIMENDAILIYANGYRRRLGEAP